jgi:hypothetical protein
MWKLRVSLIFVTAIEIAFFYINDINIFISSALVIATFTVLAYIFAPRATWLDSEAKVKSMQQHMPHILSALDSAKKHKVSNLDTQDGHPQGIISAGQRFKKIAKDKGLNIDIFSESEIELIHQTIFSRFLAASNTRAEQIPDEIINYITFHMLLLGADIGKRFIESHIDYEVSKYQDSGIRPTYDQGLNLETGEFSPCKITAKQKCYEISKAALAIINTIPSVLKIEMSVGMASDDIFYRDNYALGYVFGFIEGVMHTMNIEGDESIDVLTACYERIFASPHGKILLKRSFDILNDEQFIKGRNLGGSEAVEFKDQGLSPLGFSTHLLKTY